LVFYFSVNSFITVSVEQVKCAEENWTQRQEQSSMWKGNLEESVGTGSPSLKKKYSYIGVIILQIRYFWELKELDNYMCKIRKNNIFNVSCGKWDKTRSRTMSGVSITLCFVIWGFMTCFSEITSSYVSLLKQLSRQNTANISVYSTSPTYMYSELHDSVDIQKHK
jgi:uncharacterized oligopeptide transporter (OPT) family protein